MIDPMIVAGAIVIVIGSVTTATVTILGAFGKMRAELLAVAVSNAKQITVVESKTDTIHNLVNGSADKAAEKLTALENQIVALHGTIQTLQQSRVEDAQKKNPA